MFEFYFDNSITKEGKDAPPCPSHLLVTVPLGATYSRDIPLSHCYLWAQSC